MCVFECVFLCIITYEMCWWKAENGGRFSGAGVVSGSEPLNTGPEPTFTIQKAGNWIKIKHHLRCN